MNFFNSYLFIFLFLALVLGFWVFGLWFSLFYVFWWYDVAAHFLGGVWMSAVAFIFKERLDIRIEGRFSDFIFLIFVLSLVALAGTAWEFLEFLNDNYFLKPGFTKLAGIYEDTLSDLFFDLFGGLAGYVVYYWLISKREKPYPLAPSP